MATFAYQAVAADGKVVRGALEGADRLVVINRLQQRGLLPLTVTAAGGNGRARWWDAAKLLQKKSLGPHRQILARTLASLLNAGVPLDRSLAVSAELAESPVLRNALQQILGGVKGGKSLATAMESFPDIFPPFYVNMIRAAEASGNMAAVFTQLADYQESINELRGQIISAMIYPTLLLTVGGLSVLLLLEFVVPKFAAVFQDAGAALPLPTQILLAASDFVRTTWWAWLAGLPLLALAIYRYLQSPAGRRRWDFLVVRVPKIGGVIERILVTRFARSLGTLLQGGVPMIRALEIAGRVVGNLKITEAVDKATQGVKQGKGLCRPLAETGAFPQLSLHLMGVGEETGRLDSMLLQVADVYERESRASIKNLVALFEPLMILLMGLVVGAIVISILLAIFSVNDIQL